MIIVLYNCRKTSHLKLELEIKNFMKRTEKPYHLQKKRNVFFNQHLGTLIVLNVIPT